MRLSRRFRIMLLLVVLLYTSCLVKDARAAEFTKGDAVEYLRRAYELTDASDKVLKALLDEEFNGIPYFEWVKALMVADNALYHLQNEEYGYAINDVVAAALPPALRFVGFKTLASGAALGFFLSDAILQVEQAAKEAALSLQVKNYFEYRDIGNSHDEIVSGPDILRTDDGWLLLGSGYFRFPRPLTPKQVYEYARWLYDLKQNEPEFEEEKEKLGDEMRTTIEKVEGLIGNEDTPLIDSILDFIGDVVGGIEDFFEKVKNWFIPTVYAQEVDYNDLIQDGFYSEAYPNPTGKTVFDITSQPSGANVSIVLLDGSVGDLRGITPYHIELDLGLGETLNEFQIIIELDGYETEQENVVLLPREFIFRKFELQKAAPDLLVTSVNAPSSAKSGDSIDVSFAVNNQGSANSGSFYNRISLAATPYGTDIALGNFQMNSLAAGASLQETQTVTIPNTVSPGDYYVTVYTDSFDNVSESNEENNINSAPLRLDATEIYLVTNGDFESGSTGWVMSGDFHADSDFPYPHGGASYAYLSNPDGTAGDNLLGSMYQSVAIPSSVAEATLSFWYNITSQETEAIARDVLNITLQDTTGKPLTTVAVLSNLNKDPAAGNPNYHQESFVLTPYRGQTVRLYFLGTTNGSLPTTFRVDDVSVTVSGESVDNTPPILTIAQPQDGQDFTTSDLVVKGTASDESGIWKVTVNGNLASGTTDWSANVALNQGTNTISVVAYDNSSNHNQTTKQITVTYTPSSGQPPSIFASFQSNVTSNRATLNGNVNPNGLSTTAWFEWGSTPAYGNKTPVSDVGSGTSAVSYSQTIGGLSPDATYYYRAVAQNSAGTSEEAQRTFTTLPETIVDLKQVVRVPQNRSSIQDAVDWADALGGGAVIVAPGEYIEQPIHLRSDVLLIGSGADVTTIGPPLGSGSGVIQAGGISHATISGFTITSAGDSTGIYCENEDGSLQIVNNRVVSNYFGIILNNSSPLLIGDEVSGNNTDGIDCLTGSSPQIKDTLVFENGSVGIECRDGSSPAILNNVVAYNALYGIRASNSSNPVILNNIVSDNGNTEIIAGSDSAPVVTYNLIKPFEVDGVTLDLADGNIVALSPLFVSPSNHDYHLQPSSPAIDAGNPDSMYNDNPQTQQGGTRNDMGAYGGPDGEFNAPPIADFSDVSHPNPSLDLLQLKGHAPFAVTFLDKSFGKIDRYQWDFGDGETSTEQAPTHTYAVAGDFNVRLTVVGPGGATRRTRLGYIHVEPSSMTIPVNVPLQGYVGACAEITFEFCQSGSVLETVSTPINYPSGTGVVETSLPPGTYDISAKEPHSLRKVVSDIAVGPEMSSVNFPALEGGDADNSNFVDLSDFGTLAFFFGGAHERSCDFTPLVGDPPEPWNADFNQSGFVDLSDFGLLAFNFGKIGQSFSSETAGPPLLAGGGANLHSRVALAPSNGLGPVAGHLHAPLGAEIQLELVASDFQDLYSYAVEIEYDPNQFKLIRSSVEEGAFLKTSRAGHDPLFLSQLADQGAVQWLILAASAVGNTTGSYGDGSLAHLRFQVISPDAGSIRLSNIDVLDHQLKRDRLEGMELVVSAVPNQTTLLQNYPNPFNPETWLPYHLAEDSEVAIEIYNAAGRLVKRLDFGRQPAGYYVSRNSAGYWDGTNAFGEFVASGVYFYTIYSGHLTETRKMTLLK